MNASTDGADQRSPSDNLFARTAFNQYRQGTASNGMATDMISNVGGSRSHTNSMPYLCINFIVALFGIYPSRN